MTQGADEKKGRDGLDFIATYTRLRVIAQARGHVDGEAEDRLQEACLRLIESEQSGSVRTTDNYFKRILRNLRIDGLRRRARRPSTMLDDTVPDARPNPERIAAARRELEIAARTLELLPPRCREAFELHRFGELSYAQIAHRMGISISMVEKHITEALLRLSTALDKTR